MNYTELPEVRVGDIVQADGTDRCFQVKCITEYGVMEAFSEIPLSLQFIKSVYRYNGRDFKLVWQKESKNG